jgi:prephenate dehydrogenase
MKFKQITIIGVGLIGGSIGLAAKKRHLSSRIIGVTRHKHTLRKAIRCGAIDLGTLDIEKSVINSDMVILATPVDKILSTAQKISHYVEEGCIVIDVASVKGAIVKAAEQIIEPEAYFIGTHPMAGSEQRGIDKADGDLFKGAPCILTKTKRTNMKILQIVFNFWKALGSEVYILSPSQHDKEISSISHLPHIAASALSLAAKPSAFKFISTGFKDTTRISSSDPDLWVSILLSNSRNVAKDIENYLGILNDIKNAITYKQRVRLKKKLLDAKRKRDTLD